MGADAGSFDLWHGRGRPAQTLRRQRAELLPSRPGIDRSGASASLLMEAPSASQAERSVVSSEPAPPAEVGSRPSGVVRQMHSAIAAHVYGQDTQAILAEPA